MIREQVRPGIPGIPALLVLLALLVWLSIGLVGAIRSHEVVSLLAHVAGVVLAVFGLAGLFIVNPNEAKVLQIFGKYVGTVKAPGLRWANPFYSKRRISQRIRNFETPRLKVNDSEGNPIEIAAVVVWKVVETAEACFEVDDYNNYVQVQSEAALRNLSTSYAYDSHVEHQMSLRGNTSEVAAHLKTEIQDRLAKAGVETIEARISHLAYAPEIAAAMLHDRRGGRLQHEARGRRLHHERRLRGRTGRRDLPRLHGRRRVHLVHLRHLQPGDGKGPDGSDRPPRRHRPRGRQADDLQSDGSHRHARPGPAHRAGFQLVHRPEHRRSGTAAERARVQPARHLDGRRTDRAADHHPAPLPAGRRHYRLRDPVLELRGRIAGVRREGDRAKTGQPTYAILQAEDELAAARMVVGAGWAGARAMTSTSGPGISLMSEFVGLSYFAEVPGVIWDVQRIGPSTGLPTRTSQGDILSTYYLSHGDTKHILLIPATVEECFRFAQEAFNLAERYQTMVFCMSDLDLGMNNWMSDPFKYPDDIPIDRGKVLAKKDLDRLGKFSRYLDVDGDGITRPFRRRHSITL